MKLNQVIAKLLTQKGLPTEASQIIKIQEFHKVYNVIIKGRRPRFVSKALVLDLILNNPCPTPINWTLTAETRRQEGKKWVARIDGTCAERDGLKRTFLSAQSIDWGKYGMQKAVFLLREPGYYHDSDGDYFRVFVRSGNELDAENCSKMEVLANLKKLKV